MGKIAAIYPSAMGWTPPPVTGINCAKVNALFDHITGGSVTIKITTIGIDLAKSVFQVKHDQMTTFFTKAASPRVRVSD